MYLAAPINQIYLPRIEIGDGTSTIEIEVSERYHHAAQAVHGSVYFKLLDDAAFFAANSLERELFVLTTSFTIYLIRPVTTGTMRAEGRVVDRTRSQLIAESVVKGADGREVGRGSGVFFRGKLRLSAVPSYREAFGTA
jgi:uncharacterized protein (TIGR00369 family)